MAGSILSPEPEVSQVQLQRILDLRRRIAELKSELSSAEMVVRFALEAGIEIEQGPFKALLEDRFDAAQGKITTHLQIYSEIGGAA